MEGIRELVVRVGEWVGVEKVDVMDCVVEVGDGVRG